MNVKYDMLRPEMFFGRHNSPIARYNLSKLTKAESLYISKYLNDIYNGKPVNIEAIEDLFANDFDYVVTDILGYTFNSNNNIIRS